MSSDQTCSESNGFGKVITCTVKRGAGYELANQLQIVFLFCFVFLSKDYHFEVIAINKNK